MLQSLYNIIRDENICNITDELCDSKVECENEAVNRYIEKLLEIIDKQKKIINMVYEKINECKKGASTKNRSTQTDPKTETLSLTENTTENSWRTEKSVEETVKEVAENAMKQTGFVYDPASKMYYDYNSGYHYSAEYGLYYDSNTGTYYSYDKDNNTLQFHSQVEVPTQQTNSTTVTETTSTKASRKRDKHKSVDRVSKKFKRKTENDMEEGECSDDSEPQSDASAEENVGNIADEEIQGDCEKYSISRGIDESGKRWPPCMRIVVKETTIKTLQVGSLFIITCTGGTLGREGDHAILIPDINISKYHAKFIFDNKDEKNETGNYTLTDLGSRNGTYLDGKRLSTALQESEPFPMSHDCQIRVGGTILLCHIHSGNETCAQCEPGLLMTEKEETRNAYVLEENMSEKRKKQLKKLKQKFGLSSGENVQVANAEYKDRAEIRRQTVGSHSDSFKTEVSDVTLPIKKTNKGFKMLAKMGWSEGESLGTKSEDGIKEPVLVQQRAEKVGLGYDKPVTAELEGSIKKKQEIWKKVQSRYSTLE